jgi:hypothetical protein
MRPGSGSKRNLILRMEYTSSSVNLPAPVASLSCVTPLSCAVLIVVNNSSQKKMARIYTCRSITRVVNKGLFWRYGADKYLITYSVSVLDFTDPSPDSVSIIVYVPFPNPATAIRFRYRIAFYFFPQLLSRLCF